MQILSGETASISKSFVQDPWSRASRGVMVVGCFGRRQLGHSSLAVTERYFEVDPIEQQRAIDNLKF